MGVDCSCSTLRATVRKATDRYFDRQRAGNLRAPQQQCKYITHYGYNRLWFDDRQRLRQRRSNRENQERTTSQKKEKQKAAKQQHKRNTQEESIVYPREFIAIQYSASCILYTVCVYTYNTEYSVLCSEP